ncbi:MAG: sigma-70 family RNA polymerase sigma factor [Gemmatimonadetes bacterium]|nr:sigma-70 family RNA polymerase sigma factor [Gemmatimonadota bacterium]
MDVPELTRDELEALLERLHEASFGWALSCTEWNDADAEDVLQTTYMKVVSGRARFGGRSAFRTWLFGVIRQTAREHARRARSHRQRAEMLAREVPTNVEESADAGAERAERSRLLLGALAELPDRQREVLHLVFYQDLTIREAAEVMDVSVGSARVHYERGKKRLRSLLSERDVGGGDE